MLSRILLACAWGLLLRCSTGLSPYSGQGKPPMFGDYEAQRHWMEITVNLPVTDWYRHTPHNDLLYWGLDYPPLTAYHSYACGVVADWLDPSYVALNSSRGFESHSHKFFMRATVLLCDICVFLPALVWFFSDAVCKDKSKFFKGHVSVRDVAMLVGLTLSYPGFILVDHGHFQYNNVSLGLTLAGVAAIGRGWDVLGSVFFCLALNHKQMELYHALPFFFYLLGLCFRRGDMTKLLKLAFTVSVAFAIIWLPFLFHRAAALDVIHRLFPLSRGVFEDKVANFWCTVNNVVKIKEIYTGTKMAWICLGATATLSLPSCLHLLYRPTLANFLYSLINVSFIFFLFSFQVHEKSILLVALPAVLLFPKHPFPCFWFLTISTFSMTPLLLKDGLLGPLIALTTVYYVSFTEILSASLESPSVKKKLTFHKTARKAMRYSLCGCVALLATTLLLKPPLRYPDLFPVLTSAYSCAHFLLFALYFHWQQFSSPVK